LDSLAKRFQKIDFQQEGTDIYEAWLATCKRILRYNSDRKKEHALLELITRLAMEDFVSNGTVTKEKKWDRISKVFKEYKWREYFIPAQWILKSRGDWVCFFTTIERNWFFRTTRFCSKSKRNPILYSSFE